MMVSLSSEQWLTVDGAILERHSCQTMTAQEDSVLNVLPEALGATLASWQSTTRQRFSRLQPNQTSAFRNKAY